MKQTDLGATLERVGTACRDLLDAEMTFCRDLMDGLGRAAPAAIGCGCGRGNHCRCDIPEPCWMPRPLGEHCTHLCPGATATVRLRIVNCDRTKRTFTVTAAGAGAGHVSIAPTTLALGAKEADYVTVTFKAPPDAKGCEKIEALVWVLGCHEHYLRWHVEIGHRERNGCLELTVEDCPDYVHHWYDHFYCVRPCYGRGRHDKASTGRG